MGFSQRQKPNPHERIHLVNTVGVFFVCFILPIILAAMVADAKKKGQEPLLDQPGRWQEDQKNSDQCRIERSHEDNDNGKNRICAEVALTFFDDFHYATDGQHWRGIRVAQYEYGKFLQWIMNELPLIDSPEVHQQLMNAWHMKKPTILEH